MDNTIEKQIEIKAPISKVFKALTDSKQFGQWFEAKFEGPFVEGQVTNGKNLYPGYEFDLWFKIEKITPETYFSYRWHPLPNDPKRDYSKETPTLVEFKLEDKGQATLLTVVESGFNDIPADRRAEAFRMHTGGWEGQLENISNYVSK